MLSSEKLGLFRKTSLCYNSIRGTRQSRIIPYGICGIDHDLRHDLIGLPVPHFFRINSHRSRFLQTDKSLFRTPGFIFIQDGVSKESEFSGDGASGGFFGFTPFPQMVIKISDNRIKETTGSGSDKECHFKGLIAFDSHFKTGFDFTGFPDNRIKADIADKSFRSWESFDITDLGEDSCDGDRSEAGDRVEAMVRERRVESGNDFSVESFNLRKQLNKPFGSPLDDEGSSVRQGFNRSIFGKFDEVGGEFRADFMSEGDREIANFGFSHGDDFARGRDQGESDEHFHRDFFPEELFVSGEMDTEKPSETILEFGGFFLERSSDAGEFFEFFLPGQIRKRRFGSHLSEVESNHMSIKFVCFINLKMHFLKLLDSIGIDDVNFNFSRSGGIENGSKIFVEVGSGLHSGNNFCFLPEERSGGDDCSFKVTDTVRGIGKSSVGSDGLTFNISESDVKLCFGDVDTDKKFFHSTPPEKTQINSRLRQRGSSETLARLSLPNCAVVPQDIIKAQSRGMRRHPPNRGRATQKMKACSSSPRYKIYQNKKNKVGRSNLDTWIPMA